MISRDNCPIAHHTSVHKAEALFINIVAANNAKVNNTIFFILNFFYKI
ncbi:MAG: hypothetical protein WCG25_09855 [bacterium]